MHRIYITLSPQTRRKYHILSRQKCQFCGKIVVDGEEIVATRHFKKDYVGEGFCNYKHVIHRRHLDAKTVKEWISEDIIDRL